MARAREPRFPPGVATREQELRSPPGAGGRSEKPVPRPRGLICISDSVS